VACQGFAAPGRSPPTGNNRLPKWKTEKGFDVKKDKDTKTVWINQSEMVVRTRRYGKNRLVVDITEIAPRFTSSNRSRRIANQHARKAGLKLSSATKLFDFETTSSYHVLSDYDLTLPVHVRQTSYSFGSVARTT